MRETPGAETYAPEAWDHEAATCLSDGLPPPDRAGFHLRALEAGWTPWEPLHEALYRRCIFARYSAKVPGIESVAEPIAWPWCAASAQDHVLVVAQHFAEAERIAMAEARR